MMGMKVQDAYEYVKSTPYHEIVPEGEVSESKIAKLEDGFSLLGYRYANKIFVWEPFDPLVSIGIIKLKELEVRNLTSISFGVEHSIPSPQIREGLIFLG